MKEADLRDMMNKATKGVCALTIILFSDPLPLTPSTSSAVKIPENTEEDQQLRDVSTWNTRMFKYAAQV